MPAYPKVSATSALALIVVLGATVAIVAQLDVADLGGGIKGDEATYVGMAARASLDGDLAPHQAAELLVRSPERLQSITVGLKSPQACEVLLQSGASRLAVRLGGDRQDQDLVVPQTFSRDSFAFVLRVDASACAAPIEVALQGRR